MNLGILKQKSGAALYAGLDWQLISRQTISSPQTSISFSNLLGDSDIEYRIIGLFKNAYNGTANIVLYLNGDTGANYGTQYVKGYDASMAAGRFSGSGIQILSCTNLNYTSFSDTIIQAKSGSVRPIISKEVYHINGATIGNIHMKGACWNNTVDEVTSLTLTADQSGAIGSGSDIFLFARRKLGSEATSGMRMGSVNVKNKIKAGVFQLVGRHEVTGSAITSYVFSDLLGNTNPLFLLRGRIVNPLSETVQYFLNINNDGGPATNYGYQRFSGVNTTLGANRITGQAMMDFAYSNGLNQLMQTEFLLYAKSGNSRIAIVENFDMIASVNEAIRLYGEAWNNTADELTAISIGASSSGGIGIGSILELYQLNLGA